MKFYELIHDVIDKWFCLCCRPTYRDESTQTFLESNTISTQTEFSEYGTCQICLDNIITKTVSFRPCGHTMFCVRCANIYLKRYNICPICRREITSALECRL